MHGRQTSTTPSAACVQPIASCDVASASDPSTRFPDVLASGNGCDSWNKSRAENILSKSQLLNAVCFCDFHMGTGWLANYAGGIPLFMGAVR